MATATAPSENLAGESNADAAKRIAAEVASTLVKPQRNGVSAVSDKPATRKAKAKPAPARWQTVTVNGKKVKVPGDLSAADALKQAKAAIAALAASKPGGKGDKPVTSSRAAKPKRESTRQPRTPANTFAKYLANGPSGAHGEQFERGMASADAEYVSMLEQALKAPKAKRARILAAMFAAMRVHYSPTNR